jgi:hypothetical protein
MLIVEAGDVVPMLIVCDETEAHPMFIAVVLLSVPIARVPVQFMVLRTKFDDERLSVGTVRLLAMLTDDPNDMVLAKLERSLVKEDRVVGAPVRWLYCPLVATAANVGLLPT